MKRLLAFLLALVMVLGLCGCREAAAEKSEESTAAAEPAEDTAAAEDAATAAEEETEAEPTEEEEAVSGEAEIFADWNQDAPALNALIEYVEAVTDEDSADFIPVEDRLAVFDMDGTLYGELFPTYLEYYMLAWRILKDPSITPDAEMLALGRELRESVTNHSFASDMPMRHAVQAARAYSGMTLQEFADFVNNILVRDVDGFEGMTYATAFYTPMLEVIDYLQENDFKVFVCSGSDRFICRNLLEGMIDIPYENIIGMDVAFEATGQGDTDGLDYVFQAGDDVVRTDKLIIKNLKMNKVLQIIQDIGRKPVLSFGNSSGDVSMHMYTISNNPYRSAAFMLIANDEERDYGNAKKAEKLGEEWEADGFHVISMRDDFRTIYGDDVVKTGSFRWEEELAEDRVALEDMVTLSDDSSDFVLLSEAVPDAILEIRYYSTYNFVGDRIDGYEEPLAFLTREAAEALKEVSDDLLEKGYRLKIYDAYRPQMAVTHFANWAQDAEDVRMKEYFYPELEKDVLFPQGYIAAHSGHSRGSTVDLTLFDMTTEKEVDMGGTFDYFGELSHPDYTGITEEQYANRMLLREAMMAHGLRPLAEEWWHFTLEEEPFPDTYFTFPINSDAIVGNDAA